MKKIDIKTKYTGDDLYLYYNRTPFSHKESSVGQFHSYIKELNKITIIDGYDIIVKDVNECEIIN